LTVDIWIFTLIFLVIMVMAFMGLAFKMFRMGSEMVKQIEIDNRVERSYLLDRIQSGDPEAAKRINLWEPPKERKPVPQRVSFGTGLGLKVDTARTREEIGELES
jgi:hypothetical protein